MGGRLPLRSVDSEIKGRAIEPRNVLVREPSSCQPRGPRRATTLGPGCLVPPGSKNRANDHEGSPGTWEPCRLHRHLRLGNRNTNSPDAPGRASRPLGAKRAQGWYRQAKATKCGEMDGRESERLIVAWKRGNGPSRTPWSEGGAALWTGGRNHAEGIEPPCVSPRGHGSCEGQRTRNVTSRMRLQLGTSGSVGAPGSNPQGDPARCPGPRCPRTPMPPGPRCPPGFYWTYDLCRHSKHLAVEPNSRLSAISSVSLSMASLIRLPRV